MRCDITKFEYTRKPLQHQADFLQRFGRAPFAGLLFEMGCGKSKALTDNISMLYQEGEIDGALILAPKGIYNDWVTDHLTADLPKHIKTRIVRWESGAGKRAMETLRQLCKPEPGVLDILVMNTEAIIGDTPAKVARYFTQVHKALVAVDESTNIGNEKARRTTEILRVGQKAKYRRILTGDAAPDSPLTVYSQMEFLQPGLLGHSSFFAFKARYCVSVPIEVSRVDQKTGKTVKHKVSKITGYRDLDKLREKISNHCFVVRKEDCLDLPPKLPAVIRGFDMSPAQAKIYEEMKQKAFVEIEKHVQSLQQIKETGTMELTPSMQSSAQIKLVQLLRCHQIASGFLVSDEGKEIDIPGPNKRIEEMMDVLEETSGKVLIWSCYRRSIHQIEDAIRSKYGPESVATYFGDTTVDERTEHKQRFQKDKDFRFLIINQATGKFGLTLTAANVALYFNQGYSREARAQSEDRIHRIGQKFPCTYIDLMANKTVDWPILQSHRLKQSISELLGASNWKEAF